MPALFDRRTLLKAMASLAGGAALPALNAPIAQALAIDPPAGSTFLDAEHVVFLMQENRSFDHCFGALQGVRGFNDPRAIDLPGGRPVWLQADAKGQVFAPFRLDMDRSNDTWLGCLPHGWGDQVDALNHGKYDRWIPVKRSGSKLLANLPLTMGYHTREDLPFYYALADAFTVCDQHFCSTLTGTSPNRLHFFSGTIRAQQTPESMPHIHNSDIDHTGKLTWTTYPERLSEHGVSWKVYQNELTVDSGLSNGEVVWLGNFGDNPLEYFAQYGARYSASHREHLERMAVKLTAEVARREAALAEAPDNPQAAAQLAQTRKLLEENRKALEDRGADAFARLPARERELHERGLCTNRGSADYRQLDSFATKSSDGKTLSFTIPKGDILHQFREDVQKGRLPTVSWLVAPRYFSDHPDSPWFGAWYVSETLNILTQNPDVWRKTIFVLTYDENDGYFDHCPPFRAPAPGRPETGACSPGADSSLEYITRDRESSVGLGYRVPMVVASPWSRGGWVNSQVFDHTSSLRFLEQFFQAKQKKSIREPNINAWRRAVAGDLTSIFRPATAEEFPLPKFLDQTDHLKRVHEARGKPLPDCGQPLTEDEIAAARRDGPLAPRMPRQEPGVRPSCALPYEIRVEGALDDQRKKVRVSMSAGNRLFGEASAGVPLQVYAPGRVAAWPGKAAAKNDPVRWEDVRTWYYAVAAGEALDADWALTDFESEAYFLRVYGPNGFFRELRGDAQDPDVAVLVEPEIVDGRPSGSLAVRLRAVGDRPCAWTITPNAYGHKSETAAGRSETVVLPLAKSFGWYDFSLTVAGADRYQRRYAGRVETGRPTRSDPHMGWRGSREAVE